MFPNDVQTWTNPDWDYAGIPDIFKKWGRTDYEGVDNSLIVQAGWTPMEGTAWGCAKPDTWCAWDNEGIIAWMKNGDGPHWVRRPNNPPAFKVVALF